MILFKERFRELREEKGIFQSDVAKVLNVSQKSISNWEMGSRRPDFETLVQIAQFFNVTTDYLLGVED
ncbi:MAG: helix-turn-helix transcriptional regulator [Clostridiales bacterium]|nr:helix-turn-helix transcriptional regulator [Clostridiales bacterium]